MTHEQPLMHAHPACSPLLPLAAANHQLLHTLEGGNPRCVATTESAEEFRALAFRLPIAMRLRRIADSRLRGNDGVGEVGTVDHRLISHMTRLRTTLTISIVMRGM